MDNIEILQKLKQEKIISVVRMDPTQSQETIDAIIQGGVKFIEITFTMENALDMIAYFSKKYKNEDVVIGAGTILDEVSARLAILKGAQFIVAPCFNKQIAELCNLYRIPYMPGIHNPQDIEAALRSGVDILKLFPASTLEPFIIKEFRGPFPQSDFIISGKVNASNIHDWLNNGACAVCLGSALTNQIANGRDAVIETTKSFVSLVHEKNKLLRTGKFFIQVPHGSELYVIDNTYWNYLCLIGGAIGLICCLRNIVFVAVIAFVTVFFVMNIKMIIYYKIYRQYQNKRYVLSLDGSKYSFSDPKKARYKKEVEELLWKAKEHFEFYYIV